MRAFTQGVPLTNWELLRRVVSELDLPSNVFAPKSIQARACPYPPAHLDGRAFNSATQSGCARELTQPHHRRTAMRLGVQWAPWSERTERKN